MKLSYNLKLSQSLKLTPLLQQSLKFLQASQDELNQLIEEYLNDNLFLEKEEGSSYSLNQTTAHQPTNSSKQIQGDDYYNIFENQAKNESLREYLLENLGIFSFSEREQEIFSFLIDAINDDGYLTESYEALIAAIP
ncbi:MAG TPA: hypothetical protein DHV86_06055, partial [Methylophilaceae bacterium]|nr:hypothetical protein [Methylophilaceae bacterium]